MLVDIDIRTYTYFQMFFVVYFRFGRVLVVGVRDLVSVVDVEGVEGLGFRDVDDIGVFFFEYRVILQLGNLEGYKQEGEGKGVEEEEVVVVQEEAFAFLVQDQGQYGEEGEDEEDEDLVFGDQVFEKVSG